MQLLLWNLPIMIFVIMTPDVNRADACPSLQAVNASVSGNEPFTVNLTYVVTPCAEQKNSEIVVKMLRGKSTRSPPACIISIKDKVCNSRVGCSCTSAPDMVFMVTMEVDGFDEEEEWLIVGILNNREIFRDTIKLQRPVDGTPEASHISSTRGDSTTTTSFASTPTDDSKIVSTSPGRTTTTTAPPNQTVIYIMGGVIGFVLLVLTSLAVFVGALFWKRGRSRKLPPPPPAPHNFRRAVADAVMFHAQAAVLRDSDSLTSTQGHEYAEIPDDTDLSKSDNSLSSFDSTAVSDSSMSDCLHHIACPSSDSSLPEDYLHPVTYGGEKHTTDGTGTAAAASLPYMLPHVQGKTVTAAEPPHFRVEPPYENTVCM